MGKFQSGQDIWWWDEVHLELHEGVIAGDVYEDYIDFAGRVWHVATDEDSDGRPFHIRIRSENIYATLEDARLKLTKMLYDKAKTAVAEAQKYDAAHIRLLKL